MTELTPATDSPAEAPVPDTAVSDEQKHRSTLSTLPFNEEMNDNVMRSLFFRDLFTPADCGRVLESSVDPVTSQQFFAMQQQLMPGFAQYMHAPPGRLLSMNAENNWLIEHLQTIFSAVNYRHFKFKATRQLGAQLFSLENGQHLDWHFELGAGLFSTRKLVMVSFLTPVSEYDGGEFELMATPYAPIQRDQGVVTIFPAFSAMRLTPVTRGRLDLLLSWFHGAEQIV